MELTEKQIKRIKTALGKAENLQNKAEGAAGSLANIISKYINLDCKVEYLHGDGHGVTPVDYDTYVPISKLIDDALRGNDISKDYLLNNRSL